MKITDYEFLIFDCDGVVLNSNKIKSNAFRESLQGYDSRKVDEFITYHHINGGISRYVKFRHFFEVINPVTDVELNVNKSIKRYGELVYQALLTCDLIPGVENFLRYALKLGVPCFINSGGDENELKDIFTKRSLSGYFKHILGSPSTKGNNMNRIFNMCGDKRKFLYFGDAYSDYLTCSEHGGHFIYVSGVSEWQEGSAVCSKAGVNIISNFNHLHIN